MQIDGHIISLYTGQLWQQMQQTTLSDRIYNLNSAQQRFGSKEPVLAWFSPHLVLVSSYFRLG